MSDFNPNPSPAGGETPAAAPVTPSPAPATPEPIAAQPATPAAPAQPVANPQVPQGFVPSHRIRETREAAIREAQAHYQQQLAAQNARYEAMQRQLHAVLGVTPQEDPEISQVRSQFEKLYPGLSQLEQRAKDLIGVLERSGDYDSAIQHQWQSYGRQTLDRLFSAAERSLGQPLSDEAKQILHSSFAGFVSSSPELTNRYATDPSLVDEYWRMYESSFIGPVRRTQNAQVEQQVNQRPIAPRDTPAGIAPIAAPAQPKSLDDRVKGAWVSFQAHKTGRQ